MLLKNWNYNILKERKKKKKKGLADIFRGKCWDWVLHEFSIGIMGVNFSLGD